MRGQKVRNEQDARGKLAQNFAQFAHLREHTAHASGGAASTYVVLYKGMAVPADAAKTIAGAGGTLVDRAIATPIAS
jgi:hypothetical protein